MRIVVGGFDLRLNNHRAFEVASALDPASGVVSFAPCELDLSNGTAHYMGDEVEAAQTRELQLRAVGRRSGDHRIVLERAPLTVLREFIADPTKATIGGQVELGFCVGSRFARFAAVEPLEPGEASAHFILNGTPLVESVGNCVVGIPGFAAGGPNLPLDL